ncbi:MAG: membrane dipeptidase [Bacillota bacterium]|nr:membrane dipeptidase [Bacillota bacterium]
MRVDCHCDTIMKYAEYSSLESLPHAHIDFRRIREHLDLSFFAIWLDQENCPAELSSEFRRLQGLLLEDLSRQQGIDLLLWREQLEAPEKKLILLSMEGAEPLGEDWQGNLQEFYQKGMRAIGLTWNYVTRFSGSNMQGGGLTEEGRELVRRCNDMGILLDAAHISEEGLDDLLACSRHPIIDSHTVCASVCNDWPRSINDRQLIALAEKGGVAAMTMVPEFLGGSADLEQFCRHVEYAVGLIGSRHVALGGDYDGADLHPELAGIQHLPMVYERLRQRGMAAADLQQIMGESVVTLLRQILPEQQGE